MGYIEGLLGGYVSRHREMEQDRINEEMRQSEREGKVYEALLNSPDPDLRTMAATGILDWSQPKRGPHNLSTWLGKTESSPMYQTLRKYMNTPKAHEEKTITRGLPSIQRTGYLATPPPPTSSLAQSEQSSTEAGAQQEITAPQPLSPLQPAVRDPAAPSGGSVSPLQPVIGPRAPAAEQPQEGPPSPLEAPVLPSFRAETTATPPAPARPSGPPAEAHIDRFSPASRTESRRTTWGLPQAFPTTEDTAAATRLGQESGEYEAAVRMFTRAGEADPEGRAAEYMIQQAQRSGGGAAGQSYAEGNVIADPNSPTGYSQELYLRANPNVRTRIPAQAPLTPEEAARRTTATTNARNVANTQRDLDPAEKTSLTMQLRDDWRIVSTKTRDAQVAVDMMKTAYNAARTRGDIAMGAETVQVLFQRALDPDSVVREAEANRPAQFSGLTTRIQGLYDNLVKGGGKIPLSELAKYVQLADEITEAAAAHSEDERARIEQFAIDSKLNPRNIVPRTIMRGVQPLPTDAVAVAPPDPNAPPQPPATSTAPANAAPVNAAPAGGIGLDTPLRIDPATGRVIR